MESRMSVVEQFQQLEAHASRLIIGQAHLINRMLIALLCDGHLLVEGAPGLAKTRAIKVLAESIEGDFHRLQFTPDLLPADLTGTDIYRPQEGTFEFRKGPLFHNLILADEINRAPAKVQSALLEAMEERQITVGSRSYKLDDLFMVMATQNPIEQEGTYPLPEAQLDRFLLHVEVGYPTPEDERRILVLNRDEAKAAVRDPFQPPELLSVESIMQARQDILRLHLADELEEYIVNIVIATRDAGSVEKSLEGQILYGASPRASMGIDRAARAHAWLAGRDYVGPEDIQAVAPDVLRHRLVLSFEAEADGVGANSVIERLLDGVGVP
jgi:MoxR-like ATPase